MKKQLAAAAAAALAITGACAFGGTALADDDSKSMDVQYKVASDYTLTIPTDVTLNESTETSAQIGVAAANIEPAKKLTVTVSSAGFEGTDNTLKLTHTDDESVKAETSVGIDGQPVTNNSVVATFPEGVIGSSTKTMTFSPITDANGGSKVQAGSYKTVMTFTGEIVDAVA